MATPSPGAAAFQSSLCLTPQKPSTDHHPFLNTPLSPKPKSLLQKHQLFTTPHTNISLQFKEKILCLELMGVDSGKALSQNPNLHTTPLHFINSIISFLQSQGIYQKDLGRIFGMCPQILTSSINSELNPVFKFISDELNVPENNYRRVINKCPRLLVSSVRHQLQPALLYLEALGFEDLEALAYNDAILLVSSVENSLAPKLEFLVSLGFHRDDVVSMVLRCPSLFTFSVENNFKPKFGYFCEEMEGSLEELKEFPQYFSFSLEKRIKPRHLELVRTGVQVSLDVMLKTTDEEFGQLIRKGIVC